MIISHLYLGTDATMLAYSHAPLLAFSLCLVLESTEDKSSRAPALNKINEKTNKMKEASRQRKHKIAGLLYGRWVPEEWRMMEYACT